MTAFDVVCGTRAYRQESLGFAYGKGAFGRPEWT
jgi:hypothetical protein